MGSSLGHMFAEGWDEVTSGAYTAPVPSVRFASPAQPAARTWTAPEAGGSGQLTVHADVLMSVAGAIWAALPDLDAAVSRVRAASGALGSAGFWSAGAAFTANLTASCEGFAALGGHTSATHAVASRTLTDTAATYSDAESASHRAVTSIGAEGAWAGRAPSAGPGLSPGQMSAMRQVAAQIPQVALKPNAVGIGGDINSMGWQEIMDHLHGLRPEEFTGAAAAYANLGTVLDDIAGRLAAHGETMAVHWRGTAAQAALGAFQQLHDHAAQLAVQAAHAGNVLYAAGTKVVPAYQSVQSPRVMSKSASDAAMGAALGPGGSVGGAVLGAMGVGPDGNAKADKAARAYLTSFNQQIVAVNNAMPSSGTAPNGFGGSAGGNPASVSSGGSGSPHGAPGASSGGANGATVAGVAGYGGVPAPGHGTDLSAGHGAGPGAGGAGVVPAAHRFSSAGLPGNGPGPAASLQGYAPPPSGGIAPASFSGSVPSSSGPAPGAYSGMPGLPVMPSGAGSGVPGEAGTPGERRGLPGEKAFAEQSGLPGEGEVPGGAIGDAVPGAEGGMGMMPMTGGAAGGQDKERQRQAWMNEDDDIWGVPQGNVPPVIGG